MENTTFEYDSKTWIYLNRHLTLKSGHYMCLFQNDITNERKIYEIKFDNDGIPDYDPFLNIRGPWYLIGYIDLNKKENEFVWKLFNYLERYKDSFYEFNLEKDGKTYIAVSQCKNGSFDLKELYANNYKVIDFREANYSDKMPTEPGVYRVAIYNSNTKKRRVRPCYLLDNEFLFEDGLVIGDTITHVSENLIEWKDKLDNIDLYRTVLIKDNKNKVNLIDDVSLISRYVAIRDDKYGVYKDNSRCKLGLPIDEQ